MAFHIKSTTKFKLLLGILALSVSGVAALFSVTGVSNLFKGAFYSVLIMMSILELAKIGLSSYVARFWKEISKTLKTYFILAIVILMIITSAGIFGYLSEAYQGSKGNYDITEQETDALTNKKKNYELRIEDYKNRIITLNSFRNSQEIRLDSLYSRGQITTAKRVEQGIQRNDTEIQSLNDKITSYTDSVSNLNTQIIEKNSINIKGELGPLKFIASLFSVDMDTVVKYLILMLIFVFDPLAVLMFVSLSIMIRKEHEKELVAEKEQSIKSKEFQEVLENISSVNKSNINIEGLPINMDDSAKDVNDISLTGVQEDVIAPPTEDITEQVTKEIGYAEPEWRTANWKPPHK